MNFDFMDAILLHSGTNMFTVENISSVTNMDHNSPHASSMYITPEIRPQTTVFNIGYIIVTTILFYYSILNLNQKLHDFYTVEWFSHILIIFVYPEDGQKMLVTIMQYNNIHKIKVHVFVF
jgi:hypothetical protein